MYGESDRTEPLTDEQYLVELGKFFPDHHSFENVKDGDRAKLRSLHKKHSYLSTNFDTNTHFYGIKNS